MDIICQNRDILDAIAKQLIENEKMDGKDLIDLIYRIKPDLVPSKTREKVSNAVEKTQLDLM